MPRWGVGKHGKRKHKHWIMSFQMVRSFDYFLPTGLIWESIYSSIWILLGWQVISYARFGNSANYNCDLLCYMLTSNVFYFSFQILEGHIINIWELGNFLMLVRKLYEFRAICLLFGSCRSCNLIYSSMLRVSTYLFLMNDFHRHSEVS